MIKYLGFSKNIGMGRVFSFGFGSGGDNGGVSSSIPYLSFPLTRLSRGINVDSLPLTMDRVNASYDPEKLN